MKKILIYLILIASFSLHIVGLRWGLPSEERKQMLLPESSQTQTVYKEMVAARELLFQGVESIFMTHSLKSVGTYEGSEAKQGKYLRFNLKKGHKDFFRTTARSYLIRTFEPDISNVMNAFSSINPKQFDFFPNTFSYGLIFVGLYGAFLKALALFGFINLQSNLLFYLTSLGDLAGVYFGLRIFGILVQIGVGIVLYKLSRLYLEKTVSFFVTALYYLLPCSLIVSYEVKPHLLGTFFILLGLYYLNCYMLDKERAPQKKLIFSGASFGLAVGCVIVNPLYLLFGLIPFLDCFNEKKVKNWIYYLGAFAIFSLIGNLYAFIYPNIFVEEVLSQKSWYEPSFKKILFSPVNFAKEVVNYLGFFIPLLALIGIYFWKERKLFWLSCLAVCFAYYIQFQSVGFTVRLFLIIGPIMVLLVGYLLNHLMLLGKKKIALALAGLVFFFNFGLTGSLASSFYYDATKESSRMQAGEWINTNIPKGKSIWLEKTPSSFILPPFRYEDYELILGGEIEASKPDFIVLNEANKRDQTLDLSRYKLVKTIEKAPLNEKLFPSVRSLYHPVNLVFQVYARR